MISTTYLGRTPPALSVMHVHSMTFENQITSNIYGDIQSQNLISQSQFEN